MQRVLVINDCRLERRIMTDLVLRLGYEVKSSDEYDSWDDFQSFKPDIVIANLHMNSIQGDEILARMKTARPEIRSYLNSCSDIDPAAVNLQAVDKTFVTPVSLGELETILSDEEKVDAKSLPDRQEELAASVDSPLRQVFDPPQKPAYAFCPYCGQRLEGQDRVYSFCPYCGQELR